MKNAVTRALFVGDMYLRNAMQSTDTALYPTRWNAWIQSSLQSWHKPTSLKSSHLLSLPRGCRFIMKILYIITSLTKLPYYGKAELYGVNHTTYIIWRTKFVHYFGVLHAICKTSVAVWGYTCPSLHTYFCFFFRTPRCISIKFCMDGLNWKFSLELVLV